MWNWLINITDGAKTVSLSGFHPAIVATLEVFIDIVHSPAGNSNYQTETRSNKINKAGQCQHLPGKNLKLSIMDRLGLLLRCQYLPDIATGYH